MDSDGLSVSHRLTTHMKRLIYQHLYGIGNQFIKPQGRNQWWPLNDSHWQSDAADSHTFLFAPEDVYLFGQADEKLYVRMKIAAESEQERLDKELREQVLRDIARDFKASLNEDQLAEAIDHFIRYEHLFK